MEKQEEGWALVPCTDNYWVSDKGYILHKNHYKNHNINKPLRGTISCGVIRVNIIDRYGKRRNIPLAETVLECFGNKRPDRTYKPFFKDGNIGNCSLPNLSWICTTTIQTRNIPCDDRGERFIYKGIRSCNTCKKYPCMDRQKNGLTTFDFGAYGCVQYIIK